VAPLTSMYIMVTQVGKFINVLLVDVNKISNQIMDDSRVGLTQLIKLLVVELIRPCLNTRFDIRVVFILIIFLVGGDVHIDSKILLVTDLVNLKIKPVQSFEYGPSYMVYVHVFI
jgi:hypothetical protein